MTHFLRRHAVEVQLVGVFRSEPPGHVWTIATDHDRDSRLLYRRGLVDCVLDAAVLALEKCMVLAHHPARDLELVLENSESLRGVRKAIAVGEPLVALPARAKAQLGA